MCAVVAEFAAVALPEVLDVWVQAGRCRTAGRRGRAGGPHAWDAHAGSSAGAYRSAALFSSPQSATPSSRGWPKEGSPALLAWLFGERYELPPAWGVTQKCMPSG